MASFSPRTKTWACASIQAGWAARAAEATATDDAMNARRGSMEQDGVRSTAEESPSRRRTSPRCDLGLVRHLHLGHVFVALRGEPQRIVAELDRWVFGRPFERLAARQALDHGVVVGIAEERHGVAQLAGDVAHAMRRRQEALVAPAVQDIAAIDDEG